MLRNQSSSSTVPIMAANTASVRVPSDNNTSISSPPASLKPSVERLSAIDRDAVRKELGAPLDYNETPPENSKDAKKLPPHGLYKLALGMENRASMRYYFIMVLYNFCVILQLILGATLTALAAVGSATTDKTGVSITVIAAANTVNAGVIALLHYLRRNCHVGCTKNKCLRHLDQQNSGFPQRLRSDMNEYSKVVQYIEKLFETGNVPVGMTKDEAVNSAWDKYDEARATVEKNQPTYYVGQTPATAAPAAKASPGDLV
ncbi:uncharacterized protein LY89DRAFT_117102 [Mollisia scopiformis]|uniref:SMODS and SLOG-associating 2TM effector domain-containing protein n=1 Tax=Mollisia scopiformis TaxID=149040 RepID=A0A194X685_MOLSC|nr:uncharacterized protein LY89DRAFT_117102 [Mollisia scopiformis]KUJ15574.1 hypothetical protein LY89DRAFT_117102 [Mollisia scopiformis]